ncbi:response regulator [Sphingomonas sp. AR_OL41]|jgi:DNA-binding NarL/FixJ family response regulator|uniref:response regulator n=1 Tax=Parasphingomonas halimpatiens TaxID=3096162 RepID=UPI0024816B9A|nr:response regulator [Sphingomonas sp. AR_OL41]MDH7973864.1 response regulator [Sphingomonas sp. AR_OL41]
MGKTAIIVEDEIFVALDLERILVEAGYSVVGIAADRLTACDIGRDCDFAFIDVNLRDGPTGPAIADLLAREHDVKVVFVTANPSQIADDAQALGYVRKPFSEAAITAAAAIASGGTPLPEAASQVVLFSDLRA